MPKISAKGSAMPQSPIRKLVPYAQSAKNKGVNVLHLNIGQPDIKTPKTAIDAVKNIRLDTLAYSRTEGSDEHRSKVAAYYNSFGAKITAEDLIITTGGSEALSFVMASLLDAEDEIIIPEPFYANYNGFASAASVSVVPVISEFHSQFQLPALENISEKITAKTRAILLCNPSNPTGYVYSKKEINTLCELAIKHDIFLIVDEVYREFIHGGEPHYSVLSNEKASQHTLMIDSVSKRYSMCGARVGSLVSRNTSLIKNVLKFAHLRLSPPTYALMASEAALTAPDSYLEGVVKEYTARRNTLIKQLEQIPNVEVSHPMGAFYCIVKLPVEDAEDFSKFLLTDFNLDNQTVMLAPAKGFYSTPNVGLNEVRIAFILSQEKLILAATILEKALEAYKKFVT